MLFFFCAFWISFHVTSPYGSGRIINVTRQTARMIEARADSSLTEAFENISKLRKNDKGRCFGPKFLKSALDPN